jgi:hypothetical protein
VSWYAPWKHAPLPPSRDISALHGSDLSDEKTRIEIEQLRVEILDQRSWRTKLLLSLLIPIGGALAFLNTWHHDHAANIDHRIDQTYTDAAKQLSDEDASVRLNGIQTLSSLVKERSWFSQHFSSSDDCGYPNDLRSRESVALIIGHLVSENDSSVLDAIAQVADTHPCLTIKPLLSVNRSAAVLFARTAGTFGGIYESRILKISHFRGSDEDFEKLRTSAIADLNAVTLRTGSPFQAADKLNETFVSRTFFVSACPFLKLFDNDMRLTMSAGLSGALLDSPPPVAQLQTSMENTVSAAALLEKTSYVLAHVIKTDRGMTELKAVARQENLHGVAVVVGDMSPDTISQLKSMGAYVQQFGVEGTCVIPPDSHDAP